jgi:accessory colonization factor AcfC
MTLSVRTLTALLLAQVAAIAALVTAVLVWMPWGGPAFAVLDVAELYRLKERELTAVLARPDATHAERAQALEQAAAFGTQMRTLLETLPTECRCLLLARGAVLGTGNSLPDLTTQARRRLGL